MAARKISTRELFPESIGGHVEGLNLDHVIFYTADGPFDSEVIERYYSMREGLILPNETFAVIFRVLSAAYMTDDALALYEGFITRQLRTNNAPIALALIPPANDHESLLGKQLAGMFGRLKIPFSIAKTEHDATRWVSQFLIRKTGNIPFSKWPVKN